MKVQKIHLKNNGIIIIEKVDGLLSKSIVDCILLCNFTEEGEYDRIPITLNTESIIYYYEKEFKEI